MNFTAKRYFPGSLFRKEKGEAMGRIRGFSKLSSSDYSYARNTRKHVTLNIETETLEYFKSMSEESGIPYQAIISCYLAECKEKNRKLDLSRL